MKIDNFILKEKSIMRENLAVIPQMKLDFRRMNFMPPSAADKFSCVIEVNLIISDANQNGIASARIAFFIFATLEDEPYEQNAVADKLFEMLKTVYWEKVNLLLKETNLPPVPLKNFFPKKEAV